MVEPFHCIGKAIASAFLREGCRVCVTGRGEAPLSNTLEELRSEFGDECVISFCGDLTDPAKVQHALRTAYSRWNRLDIVVANLGSGTGKAGWQLERATPIPDKAQDEYIFVPAPVAIFGPVLLFYSQQARIDLTNVAPIAD